MPPDGKRPRKSKRRPPGAIPAYALRVFTPQEERLYRRIIELAPCPNCGAPVGDWCYLGHLSPCWPRAARALGPSWWKQATGYHGGLHPAKDVPDDLPRQFRARMLWHGTGVAVDPDTLKPSPYERLMYEDLDEIERERLING